MPPRQAGCSSCLTGSCADQKLCCDRAVQISVPIGPEMEKEKNMASLRIRRTYAAALAIAVLAAPSAMAASFDGDWSLVVQSPDHCGTTIWKIAIRDGQVYYPEGFVSGYPVGIAGLVSPSGVIRVNVAFGPRYATGVGRLRQLHGSGRWSGVGPSGTCAGVWTATRVTAYRMGADFGYRLSGRARR